MNAARLPGIGDYSRAIGCLQNVKQMLEVV